MKFYIQVKGQCIGQYRAVSIIVYHSNICAILRMCSFKCSAGKLHYHAYYKSSLYKTFIINIYEPWSTKLMQFYAQYSLLKYNPSKPFCVLKQKSISLPSSRSQNTDLKNLKWHIKNFKRSSTSPKKQHKNPQRQKWFLLFFRDEFLCLRSQRPKEIK